MSDDTGSQTPAISWKRNLAKVQAKVTCGCIRWILSSLKVWMLLYIYFVQYISSFMEDTVDQLHVISLLLSQLCQQLSHWKWGGGLDVRLTLWPLLIEGVNHVFINTRQCGAPWFTTLSTLPLMAVWHVSSEQERTVRNAVAWHVVSN